MMFFILSAVGDTTHFYIYDWAFKKWSSRAAVVRYEDAGLTIYSVIDTLPVHLLDGGKYLYACGNGRMYRSADTLSWEEISPPFFPEVLAVKENGAYELIGIAKKQRGVCISLYQGNSWSEANDGLSSLNVFSLFIANDTSWATKFRMYAGTDRGVFISNSLPPFTGWDSIPGLYDTVFAIEVTPDLRIYAGTPNGIAFHNGNTWSYIFTQEKVIHLALHGDTLVAGTPTRLYASIDGGNTWDIIRYLPVNDVKIKDNEIWIATEDGVEVASGVENSWYPAGPDVYDFDFCKNTECIFLLDNLVFAGTRGGIFKMTTSTSPSTWAWEDMNRGYSPSFITDSLIHLIKKSFLDSTTANPSSGVYPVITGFFGLPLDVDGNNKVVIVCAGIHDNYASYHPYRVYTYFDPVDESLGVAHSNEGEIIYLDPEIFEKDPEDLEKYLAHALVRMIAWKNSPDDFVPRKDMKDGISGSWVVEGLCRFGEYLVRRGEGNQDTTPLSYPLNNSLTMWGDQTYWDESPDVEGEMIPSYIFLMYLYSKFGSSVLQEIMNESLPGEEGVDAVLENYGTTMKEEFKNLIPSLILSNISLLPETRLSAPLISPGRADDYPYNCSCFSWSVVGWRMQLGDLYEPLNQPDSVLLNATDSLRCAWVIVKIDTNNVNTGYEFPSLSYPYNEAHYYIGDFYDGSLYQKIYYLGITFDVPEKCDFVLSELPGGPYPPQNIRVKNYLDGMVKLSWEPPPGETKYLILYRIYRSDSSGGPFLLINETENLEYTDTLVENDHNYYYVLTSLYSTGESWYSEEIWAYPTAFPPPVNLRAAGGTEGVLLTWSLPPQGAEKMKKAIKEKTKDISHFRVLRCDTSGGPYSLIGDGIVDFFFVDSTLSDSAYYVVQAIYSAPAGTSAYSEEVKGEIVLPESLSGRAADAYVVENVGEVWSAVSNFGNYGDPNACNTGRPSFDWPGGSQNYYLWEGRFWVGAVVNGETLVSHAEYFDYEWHPARVTWERIGEGVSHWDIVCSYSDETDATALGIEVWQRALQWNYDLFNNFIAFEYRITYDKTKFYTGSGPDTLENLVVAWVFDADVCNEDPSDCHIDDIVSYDGWAPGWDTFHYTRIPCDTLTVKSTVSYSGSDGVPDQFTIYGDDWGEHTLHGEIEYIPRNMSFIYDGDNPSTVENDAGENGGCAGYIFGRLIYAPPSPSDSVWVDEYGDTARWILPLAHQWWNWEEDPGDDAAKYRFMVGISPEGYQFRPNPLDMNREVFDYRFLLSSGPFKLASGETLTFVFAAGVGQGMDGGVDNYWGRGYLPGARHVADLALKAYYAGSQHSDPLHPSGPFEDIHWLLPLGVKKEPGSFELYLSSTLISGEMEIRLSIPRRTRVDVSLVDVAGRKRDIFHGILPSGTWKTRVNIREIPPGVYFVEARTPEERRIKKIVVIK